MNGCGEVRSERLHGVDLLRGLVMVLMALDHVRDYFGDIRLDPQDVATTTPALFATRWITHFCAPVFVFLAGTSAWLFQARGRSRTDLSKFLLTRGLWLIALEFTVIQFAWMLTFGLGWYFLQVIAAIGFGMVLLSALVYLPNSLRLLIALAIVGGHDLLDPAAVASSGVAMQLAFGSFAIVPLTAASRLLVIYALIPWAGVLLLGYSMGPIFTRARASRRRTLLAIGAAATVAFLVLRYAGVYGDPAPFAEQAATLREAGRASTAMSVVAFCNCAKYPPSLLYLLMTLGPALLTMALVDRPMGALGRVFVVFGRVPLFYYVVHLYVIHLGARTWYLIRHGEFFSPMQGAFTGRFPAWFGSGLPTVYVAWIVLVAALYPVCRWYAGVKRRGSSRVWSYL